MQKHPMLTVKEAAAALGMDERSVREKLAIGQLKGEKKTVGLKDKWFIYNGEIAAALAKRRVGTSEATSGFSIPEMNELLEHPVTVDIETLPAENKSEDSLAQPAGRWYGEEQNKVHMIVEQVMKPLVDKVAAQAEALSERDRIIEDQGRQLRLLPDLEKRAEEERKAAELKALEVEALNKQIAALEEAHREKELKLEKVESLESQVASLNEQLQFLQRPWWKKWF